MLHKLINRSLDIIEGKKSLMTKVKDVCRNRRLLIKNQSQNVRKSPEIRGFGVIL